MLKNKNIICISSIDWDFIWQGHQEIMSTFAREGNRVLFIENTGVRRPKIKDLPRLKKRIFNWWKGTKGFRMEAENLYIFSPIFFPFPYSRVAQTLNKILFIGTLKKWLEITGFTNPIIWTFLPTRTSSEIIKSVNNKIVVYYCIADFYELVLDSKSLEDGEKELLQNCDVVFAQNKEIKEKCLKYYDKKVHIFPFGVNVDNFLNYKPLDKGCLQELKQVKKPIIGYIGGIHKHIDFELIKFLAERNRSWSFLFIGPVQADINDLKEYDNVIFLGQKDFRDLPRYLYHFDVGLIPYVSSIYTKTVYPTKLNEYFAMKKPVVSTSLPEIIKFNQKHKNAVNVGNSYKECEEKISESLKNDNDDKKAMRVEIAKKHNWFDRIEEMSNVIEEAMKQKNDEIVNWQKQLRDVYKKTRNKVLKLTFVIMFLWFLCFHTPIVWFLTKPLSIYNPPKKADAVVVFAGGVGESGIAGQGYEERVKYGVELYSKKHINKLVFSSGYKYAFTETEIMKNLALSLNVNKNDIVLQSRGKNTFENVTYVNDILKQNGWNEILVVSTPFHMRRVSLVFDHIVKDVRVSYVPIPYSLFYNWPRETKLISLKKQITIAQIRALLHEYLGIVYYWWKGWI